MTEDELCEVFADAVRDIPSFRRWLLGATRFAIYADSCRLLDIEQMALRPRRRWWRHWWCTIPELSEQRETDIFMVFEIAPSGHRFALHVENKKDNYRFSPGQAAAYAPRARHMLNRTEFLSHTDFETVLLAPVAFRNHYTPEAELFDVFVSYEDVAHFLPEFGGAAK